MMKTPTSRCAMADGTMRDFQELSGEGPYFLGARSCCGSAICAGYWQQGLNRTIDAPHARDHRAKGRQRWQNYQTVADYAGVRWAYDAAILGAIRTLSGDKLQALASCSNIDEYPLEELKKVRHRRAAERRVKKQPLAVSYWLSAQFRPARSRNWTRRASSRHATSTTNHRSLKADSRAYAEGPDGRSPVTRSPAKARQPRRHGRRATGRRFKCAEGRRAALAALRKAEFLGVVIDETLAECDPAAADHHRNLPV